MCGAAWFRWSLEEATLFRAGIEIFTALYFFVSVYLHYFLPCLRLSILI